MPLFDFHSNFWERASRTFIAGVFGILPLALTFAILAWLVKFLHDLAGPQSAFGKILQSVGMNVTGCELTAYFLGLVGVVVLVFAIGAFIEKPLPSRWNTAVDGAMQRVPVLSTLYEASKNLTNIFNRNEKSAQGMTPVLCYFGSERAVVILALLPTRDVVRLGDIDYHMVLIPTAPVPFFGGALVCVKAEYVQPAKCTLDELVGIYMSMGASAPATLGREVSA